MTEDEALRALAAVVDDALAHFFAFDSRALAVADYVREWLREHPDAARALGIGAQPVGQCPRCDGCGQIADSEDGEPWTTWTNLPSASRIAVAIGLVKPLPCPVCGGSGES